MKSAFFRLVSAAGLLLLFAGCQGLDLTPEGDSQRVAWGSIKLRSDAKFPPDAQVVVRVTDPMPPSFTPRTPGNEIPVGDRGRMEKTEKVLGEQVIWAPGSTPIPFRVEFQADDAALRRGLNVDVRISVDGKVRFRTMSAHMVTLASIPFGQEVFADPAN